MNESWMEYERSGSGAIKWEQVAALGETLPFWVADMDFPPAHQIIDAVKKRLDHPFLGYSHMSAGMEQPMIEWFRKRHKLSLTIEDIYPVSGVVPALFALVEAFSQPGEGIIYQPPVYAPIRNAAESRGRKGVPNPLVNKGGRWEMDLKHLNFLAKDPENTLLLLCSPHNPVGRVWEKEVLQQIIQICRKNNVFIVSDEIHGDLTVFGNKHTPIWLAGGEEVSIILTATGKTFNIPGLNSARAFLKNVEKKKALLQILSYGYKGQTDPLNEVAAEAAYKWGGPWLEETVGRVEENYELLSGFCQEMAIPLSSLEGTYLAWLDMGRFCSKSAASEKPNDWDLVKRLEIEASIKLSPGSWFGMGGEGFARFNLAAPKGLVEEGIDRLKGFVTKNERPI